MTTEATEESTDVAVREPERMPMPFEARRPGSGLPTMPELSVIMAIAGTAGMTQGMVPSYVKTKEQAAAIMIAGHELGLGPMNSLQHLFVVNGKIQPDGQAMAAVAMANDPTIRFEITETSAEACSITMHRRGGAMKFEATIQDAKRAGLVKPGPWEKFPADMLRWFVIKRLCRLGAADVMNAVQPVVTMAGAENLLEAAAPMLEAPDPDVEIPEVEIATVAEPSAEGPPDDRAAFADWCVQQQLVKAGQVERYLGLTMSGDDPIQAEWVDPMNEAGYTTAEALGEAQSAITAVLAEAVKLQKAKDPDPLTKALAAVGPLGYRDRAIAERTPKEAPEDEPPPDASEQA